MKKQYFVANWKSNKTIEETKEWLEEFQISNLKFQMANDNEVILCPPFPLLPMCHEFIQKHHLSISLGSQDISPFTEGAYTGAVSGKLLRAFVTYSIIGHSERRKLFHETLDDLSQKVAMALSCGITPIYCVSDKEEKIPHGVRIVAYEPLFAIGSGNPDTPEHIEAVASFIKSKNDVVYILYGGSVTAQNAGVYTDLASINGVLVGGASLSPQEFAVIIQHV